MAQAAERICEGLSEQSPGIQAPVELFEPYLVLPSQYFAVEIWNHDLEGELRLALAVLEDAVGCFQRYASATAWRERRLFFEAAQWIYEEDTGWTFSFESICSLLQLDAAAARRALWQWRDRLLSGGSGVSNLSFRSTRLRNTRRHRIVCCRVGRSLRGIRAATG
jgi:hypothetical protein